MPSESSTAANISASVWTLSSHRPIRAKEANAANTISAARQPPKRSTISTDAASVPTQVIQSIASLAVVTSQSANARKPSRIAKMKLAVLGRALLEQPALRRCRALRAAACQIRLLGHGASPRRNANASSIRRDDAGRPAPGARASAMTAPGSPARRTAR